MKIFTGLDTYDIRLPKNLYYNQTASLKVDHLVSDEIAIKRGVRQELVMLPMLFNAYSESISQAAFSESVEDTSIMAHTLEDLQSLLIAVETECNEKG